MLDPHWWLVHMVGWCRCLLDPYWTLLKMLDPHWWLVHMIDPHWWLVQMLDPHWLLVHMLDPHWWLVQTLTFLYVVLGQFTFPLVPGSNATVYCSFFVELGS